LLQPGIVEEALRAIANIISSSDDGGDVNRLKVAHITTTFHSNVHNTPLLLDSTQHQLEYAESSGCTKSALETLVNSIKYHVANYDISYWGTIALFHLTSVNDDIRTNLGLFEAK
jgi:hypothetical protein